MTSIKGITALMASASLLAACSSTGTLQTAANRPLPPLESSPAASTFEWKPTVNFQLQIHSGFSLDGTLLPDGPPTYQESNYVAQISGRCARNIQEGVRGIGWLKMRRTLQAGGSVAVGALIGTTLGIENPTSEVLRQVGTINGMASGFANLDGIDFQLSVILSGAHAQCVLKRVELEPELARVVIVMVPLLEFEQSTPQAPRGPRS